MDACESGEIEDGVMPEYLMSARSRGLKSRGFKTATQANAETMPKRTYLYQKLGFPVVK